MAAVIKKRNLPVQVALFIFTFGIYSIYWFYETACELKDIAGDEEASPALWTVLIFIPFGIIYSCYKQSELYEKVATDRLNRWILFLLWLVFPPAVWFIVQTELNRRPEAV